MKYRKMGEKKKKGDPREKQTTPFTQRGERKLEAPPFSGGRKSPFASRRQGRGKGESHVVRPRKTNVGEGRKNRLKKVEEPLFWGGGGESGCRGRDLPRPDGKA